MRICKRFFTLPQEIPYTQEALYQEKKHFLSQPYIRIAPFFLISLAYAFFNFSLQFKLNYWSIRPRIIEHYHSAANFQHIFCFIQRHGFISPTIIADNFYIDRVL